MAKIETNPVVDAIRGSIGDLVFRHLGHQTIVGRRPGGTDRAPTPGQEAVRERFRQAAICGKAVLADPASRQIYETAAHNRGLPVFSVTVADFFNAPTVDAVDLSGYTGKSGEPIRIRATDDFEVVAVKVTIRTVEATTLEPGPAVAPGSPDWVYTTKTALTLGQHVSIDVTATDRPGHATTRTESKG